MVCMTVRLTNCFAKMKKLFLRLFVIAFAVFAVAPTFYAHGAECRWYCKRNSEHLQPACDTQFSFIEECGGIYVDKNHGDNVADKVIYLTFDVGYENGNVGKILDVMKEEGVIGSFFILENVINRNPDLVMRMASENHLVCNHTKRHKDLSLASEEEIAEDLASLEEIYNECTGYEMSKYFRFPEGKYSISALKTVEKLGYKTVFWSFAYADWDNNRQPDPNGAIQKLNSRIHNGAIVLLHSTSKTNAEILDRLLTDWKAMGYEFGEPQELIMTGND